jgi:hypothetical protein
MVETFHEWAILGYLDAKGTDCGFAGAKVSGSLRILVSTLRSPVRQCSTHTVTSSGAPLVPLVVDGKTNPALCVQLEGKVKRTLPQADSRRASADRSKHPHTRAIEKDSLLFGISRSILAITRRSTREKLAVLAQRRLT